MPWTLLRCIHPLANQNLEVMRAIYYSNPTPVRTADLSTTFSANLASSIRQRLLNRARQEQVPPLPGKMSPLSIANPGA